MSAIYGAIDLNRNAIDKDLPARFDAGYTKCKIDKNNSLLKDNVYMHCGVQYFYPRAKAEKLPFYDEESNIYITADCVIDNRKELLPELGLEATAPDGDIIFAAYKKWGKECCKHLQGLFSFVIYDAGKNEIFAAVDQFAQRCLFYHVRDGVFYFSTLFFPIPEATGLKFEENERWLVDAITLRGPVIITEPKETAIKDINKIVCGTCITVSISSELEVNETRYYDPNKTIKTNWKMTLEQSEKLMRDAVATAIENILQEQQDVAAQLSSGLDSTTVACNAAVILKKRGGKVYSYTSIPIKEAGVKNTNLRLYDETDGVMEVCKMHSNIEPEFLDCKDRNYLLESETFINTIELPCKSQHNLVWIDEIFKRASEKGLRIILSGSTGNCTFSAGDCIDVIYYYLSRMNLKKICDILNNLKGFGASRKKIIQLMVKGYLDYYKWYFDPEKKDCYKNNATRRDIGEKYSISKRFRKKVMHYHPYSNMKRMREAFYLVDAYAQIGEYDTKSSLIHGSLLRDPTRTVTVVDTCFEIPIYCYANDDYDRRLIRVGMKGIVPEAILTNIMQRGSQSGDNIYRVEKAWKTIRKEWDEIVYSKGILKYLDNEKIDKLTEMYDNGLKNAVPSDAAFLSDLYSFAKYVILIQKILTKV